MAVFGIGVKVRVRNGRGSVGEGSSSCVDAGTSVVAYGIIESSSDSRDTDMSEGMDLSSENIDWMPKSKSEEDVSLSRGNSWENVEEDGDNDGLSNIGSGVEKGNQTSIDFGKEGISIDMSLIASLTLLMREGR